MIDPGLMEVLFGLGRVLAQVVLDAVQRNDQSTVERLRAVVASAADIAAFDRLVIEAQRAKARAELGG